MKSERVGWLDIARGYSIIMIVFFHSSDWLSIYGQTADIYVYINLAFRPVRVPVFFLISGMLASRYLEQTWGELFKRRVLLLLYIYSLWSAINWIYFRYYNDGIHRVIYGKSYFQLVSQWYDPMIGLWFIWSLALYHVVTKSLINISPIYVLFGGSVLSICFFTNYFHSLSVPQLNLFWYFVFFYIGAKYKGKIIPLVNQHNVKIAVAAGFAFILSAMILLNLPSEYYKNGFAFGAIRFILSLAGVAACLGCASMINKVAYFGAFLRFLGQNTIYIYVTNELLVSIVSTPFSYISLQSITAKYLAAPIVAFFVIVFALGLKRSIYAIGGDFIYSLPRPRGFTPRP